ncbi:MAG: radical SAM protein [Elusimicrobia bacterium]|nr:radical SAM protein [Elusimicrobiota bacterium]
MLDIRSSRLRQPIKRLEFHMSYKCNSHCIFCSESVRMAKYEDSPVTFAEMIRTVTRKRREGCVHITFVGGEPTIHPRFLDLLAATKRLGYSTLLITNGVRLASPDFCAKALPLLDEIVFSVHGHTPQLHDALARSPGSFLKVTSALKNIETFEKRPFVLTNTVVTRHNLGELPRIIEFLASFEAVRHCLVSNLAPDGSALKDYAEQAVRVGDIGALAPELAAIARARGVALRFFGMPLCVLGPQWRLSNDLHWDSRTNVERATVDGKATLEDTWNYTPQRMRHFPSECEGCVMKGKCWGVFKTYFDRFGGDELRALKRRRASKGSLKAG